MYLDSHPIHRDSDIANHKNEINCSDYRFVYMGEKGMFYLLFYMSNIVLKALRRGTASNPVCKARRRLGGRLGEQGDALPICHREEMKRNRK